MKSRKAFSLIEILVVISVISLLIALLLPAVQSLRESARRLSCANNLKQIGLALTNYHSAMNTFPINGTSYGSSGPKTGLRRFFSPHTRILPFLEQNTLFSSINYSLEYDWDLAFPANFTSYQTTLAVFLCPTDESQLRIHACNYVGNLGTGPHYGTTAETPDSGNGFFSFPNITQAASFGDGLSHTVAFSERLRGTQSLADGRSSTLPSERNFSDLSTYPNATLDPADVTLQWCRVATRDRSRQIMNSGETWFLLGREYTNYTHSQEPNGRVEDGLDQRYFPSTGVSTARSFHPNGVNALMGDTSVRFVSSSVQRSVWRALGTRNGSELVE